MLLNLFPFLQYQDYPYSSGPSTGVILLYLAIAIVAIAGMWKTFEKAGQPGWAAIVPFYNIYILTKIAGKPGWWVILALIPLVNIIILFLLNKEVAAKFGKGVGFAVGLTLLGFVFWPMLGFGNAQYQGGINSDIDRIGDKSY